MVKKHCGSDSGLGLSKGAWTPNEDLLLKNYVQIHGERQWSIIPQKTGLLRCGRSCRLRWMNSLRSDIKHDNISADEEDLIIRLHKLLGNRWSLIAARIPGRTDNQIKNVWYSRLNKKPAKTATQNCNVLKPVPYKYKLPSPVENIVTANAETNREWHSVYDASSLLFESTNYSGNSEDEMKQLGACPDIEGLIAQLPHRPHAQENELTPIEMHISFDNSDNIDNIMDQGFYAASSLMSPMHFNSFIAPSTYFQGTGGDQMATAIQNPNYLNNYYDNDQNEHNYVGNSNEEKVCWFV